MRQFPAAMLLTLLSSTAHASGYSFSIGGHHITIEAGRHCRSLSCVSWSEGGSRRLRRDSGAVTAPPAPAKPAASEPACPSAVAPAPAAPAPVAPETDKPVETPDWARDWSPKDAAAPKPAEVVAHDDDSPIGNWQTEGKNGLVRIETCGAALCGYILNEATNTTAETVLSNMRAKTDAQWVGDIYSRASGKTYYAKMTFKRPGTLRVEACAIGRFFCSGNDWARAPKPDEVSAEDAEHDGADKGKREIGGHDTQPADGHGKLPRHVTARI